jgi:hypothetical protein
MKLFAQPCRIAQDFVHGGFSNVSKSARDLYLSLQLGQRSLRNGLKYSFACFLEFPSALLDGIEIAARRI